MYHRRASLGPVDLAFTDRYGGASRAPFDELNLALEGDDDPATCAANLATVTGDFAPGGLVRDMRQVHGADVVRVGVDQKPRPDADALVTTDPDVVLVVRVADCVPVLLADAEAGVVAAAHAGRPGMLAGVVPATVAAMHELGARDIHEIIVFNKSDLVDDDTKMVLRGLEPKAVFVSSRTGEGIEELRDVIEAALPLPEIEIRALVPYDRGELISQIHEQGHLLTRSHEEGGTLIHAHVSERLAAALEPYKVA